MSATTSKYLKSNCRVKSTNEHRKLNCIDFSRSSIPDLKQLDNFLFVEYLGQRHIYPKRVTSAKPNGVSSLKITYFTSDHISYLQQTSNCLQRLDLSNSNLFKLPFGIICNMNQLQVLILDNNELTESSFCKEFDDILSSTLKELSLCTNSFALLPDIISNLNNLTRLKISHNSISTIKGIEKLKKLKILNMDYNNLIQLGNGFYLMKRLEYAYLSHNQILTISIAIKHMNHLKELDLSYNNLRILPPEIFLLENLEILRLNDNKIGKIPNFKVTRKLNKTLSFVDLSSNIIIRFPDCLLRITEELDLSNNKIRIISPSVINKVPFTTTQKLILTNNLFSSPPKEICESGLKCIIQFFQETETVTKSYYGLKIFTLGSDRINKSNIITSLMDQNEDLDFNNTKELILEIFDTSFELYGENIQDNQVLNLQFIDIIAENKDEHWLMFFATYPALIVIFVDVDNYSTNTFIQTIGSWLQQVIIKQNDISFILVGITNTKADNFKISILDKIKTDMTDYFQNYINEIDKEIYKIESQSKINSYMSLSLKKLIQLKSVRIQLHEKCILINSKNLKSLKALREEIISIATKTNIFKNVMNPVPSLWSDAQLYFEEESLKFPLITVSEYEILVQHKFNLKSSALKIANFLHETGYVLWWEKSLSPLDQWIVACPFSLVECLRILFRPDLKDYLEDSLNPDRISKRFSKRYHKSFYSYKDCCKILFNKCILLPELAIILWENILPLKSIIRMLYYLCECWSLGYLVNFPNYPLSSWSDLDKEIGNIRLENITSLEYKDVRLKSAESTKSTKSTGSNLNKLPPVFFPWFLNRNNCSEEANRKWSLKTEYVISACYKFSLGLPKIITKQILLRVNKIEKSQRKLSRFATPETLRHVLTQVLTTEYIYPNFAAQLNYTKFTLP